MNGHQHDFALHVMAMFVYNFEYGVNFCWSFFRWNHFLRIVTKPAKIAKIRTRKNLVPHGMSSNLGP